MDWRRVYAVCHQKTYRDTAWKVVVLRMPPYDPRLESKQAHIEVKF